MSQKDISLSEEVKGASEASCNTLVMNEDSSKRNKNKEDKKKHPIKKRVMLLCLWLGNAMWTSWRKNSSG